MNRWKWTGAMLAVCALAATAAFAAPVPQQEEEQTYVRHDERDWEDESRYALGLGIGMINLENPGFGVDDDVELYGTINFRFAIGPGTSAKGGWRGYLEPELGYWESSSTGTVPVVNANFPVRSQQTGKTDLLLGLNIIGVMPYQAVDFFLGAGVGIHFIDVDGRTFTFVASNVPTTVTSTSVSDEALGFNAQFGVDVGLTRRATLFGVGRFDIVDDESNSLDAKVYLGLRFRFGGQRPDHWSPED